MPLAIVFELQPRQRRPVQKLQRQLLLPLEHRHQAPFHLAPEVFFVSHSVRGFPPASWNGRRRGTTAPTSSRRPASRYRCRSSVHEPGLVSETLATDHAPGPPPFRRGPDTIADDSPIASSRRALRKDALQSIGHRVRAPADCPRESPSERALPRTKLRTSASRVPSPRAICDAFFLDRERTIPCAFMYRARVMRDGTAPSPGSTRACARRLSW